MLLPSCATVVGMRSDAKFGPITIWFPDASSDVFSIFDHIAELFGLEEQHQAVLLLEAQLDKLELQPRPDIDYEGDRASIFSKNPTTIFTVANMIVELAKPPMSDLGPEFDGEAVLARMKAWKRPEPQSWKIGDVFSIPLADSRFSFGQVVGLLKAYRAPVCAWFALRKLMRRLPKTIYSVHLS
jgi:plasmid stabilization system protein ParE